MIYRRTEITAQSAPLAVRAFCTEDDIAVDGGRALTGRYRVEHNDDHKEEHKGLFGKLLNVFVEDTDEGGTARPRPTAPVSGAPRPGIGTAGGDSADRYMADLEAELKGKQPASSVTPSAIPFNVPTAHVPSDSPNVARHPLSETVAPGHITPSYASTSTVSAHLESPASAGECITPNVAKIAKFISVLPAGLPAEQVAPMLQAMLEGASVSPTQIRADVAQGQQAVEQGVASANASILSAQTEAEQTIAQAEQLIARARSQRDEAIGAQQQRIAGYEQDRTTLERVEVYLASLAPVSHTLSAADSPAQ